MAPHTINATLIPLGNGGKRPQNPPLSLETRGPPSNTWMFGVTRLTILNDSLIAARTSAQLCNVTRLETPSRTCGVRMSPSSNQTCGHPTARWFIPFGWSCTSCLMQFTAAKNHWILPTHSNVTSKIVSWLHFCWTTLYMTRHRVISQITLSLHSSNEPGELWQQESHNETLWILTSHENGMY